ncbi:hypothetical protein [Actinoplanes couchii]|uniref:Uncharacterized protein n=1 Tax=Actinoplanes couchii TaxID=403638 RepID=A0ABQ3WZF6_9ACTN|nr:hypothetical protein [Actinoplanes couchii]MDR6316051.1 hypothetical protein [Actinoplanes couchii]GID51665.1 hypothetical protein Aco03nite_000690 [Actinoplanes couchii]
MTRPISSTMVTAILARAESEAATRERGAASALIDFLKERLRTHPAGSAAIDDAIRSRSVESAGHLAEILDEQVRVDHDLGREIHARWLRVQAPASDRSGITNSVVGNVSGSVVQVRDVSGGISIHGRN